MRASNIRSQREAYLETFCIVRFTIWKRPLAVIVQMEDAQSIEHFGSENAARGCVMRSPNTRWDDVANGIQRAGLDPTVWPETLRAVTEGVGACGALLLSTDGRFQGFPVTPGLADPVEDFVNNGWELRDERLRGVSALRAKGVITDEDCLSKEARARSPYYQEFLRSHDLQEFAAVGFYAGADLWCLSVQRTIGEPAFDVAEQSRLLTLWRPLADAAALARQLGFARVRGAIDALQVLLQPGIVFDGGGRVIALNELAEALVGRDLKITKDILVFRDRASQRRFEALLARAIRGKLEAKASALADVVLDLRGRHRPIRAISLRGFSDYAFVNARALLLIGDALEEASISDTALAAKFKLTTAEARVAREVAVGASLAEIAERHNVTYATARSQLRAVFAKTDTHRQAELAAMFATLRGR